MVFVTLNVGVDAPETASPSAVTVPEAVRLVTVTSPARSTTAIQTLPVYTRISLSVLLKYKAPVSNAAPSLSSAGSEALTPR